MQLLARLSIKSNRQQANKGSTNQQIKIFEQIVAEVMKTE